MFIAESTTEFMGAEAKRYDIVDNQDNHHIAYTFGEIKKRSAVKFHNIISDHDLLASNKKFDNLMAGINHLKANNGALIFMKNEGVVMPQMREYGIGAQIIKYLGIEEIELLTTSKGQEFIGISGFGLNIVDSSKEIS